MSHIPRTTFTYLSVLYSCAWAESARSSQIRVVNHRHVERKMYDLLALVSHVQRFETYRNQFFHRYLPILCVSNTHRRLYFEIWRFSCRRQRQTYGPITLPHAHARRININGRCVRLLRGKYCMINS